MPNDLKIIHIFSVAYLLTKERHPNWNIPLVLKPNTKNFNHCHIRIPEKILAALLLEGSIVTYSVRYGYCIELSMLKEPLDQIAEMVKYSNDDS